MKTLANLKPEKQRVLLSRLLCRGRCFSCGSFRDYTGECKLSYVYGWEEWKDFVERNPHGTFKTVLEEMQFKQCLRNIRASGIFILHDEKFNLCEDCKLSGFCISEQKGVNVTDVRREF